MKSENEDVDYLAYRMPLLREVLDRYPNTLVNVDTKTGHEALVDETLRVIEEAGAHDRVVWGAAFDTKVIERMRRDQPRIARFYCGKQILWLMLFFVLGLLPFVPMKEHYFEVPMFSNKQRQQMKIDRGGRGLFVTLGKFVLSSRRFVRHLQARGVRVVWWVLNDEESWDLALSRGVAIMTDMPTELTRYLQAVKPSLLQ